MWFDRTTAALLTIASLSVVPASAQSPRYAIGRPPTPAEIAAWDIDVRADGQGLPKGRGTVDQGRQIFAQRCAACHGADGRGGQADVLAGGFGTLAKPNPVRTIGSYWPYATTIFDFVRRAMPFDSPQSLDDDQVYAVTAYLLHLNGIIGQDVALDATSLPAIIMPNRNGFVSDPRPDTESEGRR
jgi:mono/diheme cytochrome c family protein